MAFLNSTQNANVSLVSHLHSPGNNFQSFSFPNTKIEAGEQDALRHGYHATALWQQRMQSLGSRDRCARVNFSYKNIVRQLPITADRNFSRTRYTGLLSMNKEVLNFIIISSTLFKDRPPSPFIYKPPLEPGIRWDKAFFIFYYFIYFRVPCVVEKNRCVIEVSCFLLGGRRICISMLFLLSS